MMAKIKAKPYVSIFLKALKEASKVNETIKGFLVGMFQQVSMDVAIQKMNDNEEAFKIMIEKIVKYYEQYKEEGKI